MTSPILYSNLKYHKIDYPYDFMDKKGKEKVGMVRSADIKIESNGYISIIYNVEVDEEFLNVDHHTNREL